MAWTDAKFEDLLGKTLVSITAAHGEEEATFVTSDGETYRQYHYQDCCESVIIEEVVGDVSDLIGQPLLLAEEVIGEQDTPLEDSGTPEYPDSYTWTFYKLRTVKGDVTIRWLGESNGYYSESVDFQKQVNE